MTALLVLGAVVTVAIACARAEWLARARALAESIDPRTRRADAVRRVAFPALVDAIAAALGSGLSLPLAFAEVGPTLPAELAAPTKRAAAALALGAPCDVALVAYRDAIGEEDLAPFVVVLGAFARSGGRVGRSLGRVASLLRGRLALADERAALTAQGRMSAAVVVGLAPLGALFFAVATPDYLAVLLDRGRGLLALAAILEIAGALWFRALVGRVDRDDGFASLIDAVVVGLDAGLTFEQSLAALVARAPRVARLPEARHLLSDLALGRGVRDSFASFGASGAGEARVAALVSSAIRFGAPLADLLVTQADAIRATERRRAEERARRLPVLMLFPLCFTILPALLIVFLGPPLLSLVN